MLLRRVMRAVVVGAAAALAAALLPALPSCGDAFEPPCRVTARDVLVARAEIPGRLDAVALSEGENGDVVALAILPSFEAPDAGATRDGGDGGVVGDGGDAGEEAPAAFAPPSVLVAVIADGAAAPRLVHAFAAPSGLVARKDSTQSIGATFTGDGVLFHWIETSTSTAADGSVTVSASSKRQRVGLDGREGALASDPSLTCTHCSIRALYASSGAATIAILRTTPDQSAPSAATATTRLVSFDTTGKKTGAIDLGAILGGGVTLASGPPAAGGVGTSAVPLAGSFSAKLYARDHRFVVTIGRNAALFDASLAVIGAPFSLPSPSAEIDTSSGDQDIAWTGVLTAGDAAASPAIGELPDLLFESRRAAGPDRVAPVRISTTSSVQLVTRNDDRAGVLHVAGGTTWFSLVGADGKKMGGDLALVTTRTPASAGVAQGADGFGSDDVVGDPSTRSRLMRRIDRTRFAVYTAVGDVTREVVTCDP